MSDPIKVGDKLWFAPERRWCGLDRFVTVEKVGRKWAYFERHYKFDIKTLAVSSGGYSNPGTLHQDKGAWETARRADYAWGRFVTEIRNSYSRPRDITEQKIRQAAALLGIELDTAP